MAAKRELTADNLIRISVRELVEFILRSGDIDTRRGTREKDAMLEGSRIHRKIQRGHGPSYRAEVTLRRAFPLICGTLLLEGRADGIFSEDGRVWVDEIKGVYRDVDSLKAPVPVHEAQAKCYAAILAMEEGLSSVGVQMTYASLETEAVKRFRTEYTAEEITAWLAGVLSEFEKWAIYEIEHRRARRAGLQALTFPYEYRPGQKELAVSVYRTVRDGGRLFIQAPTGIGKTLAAVFPALKAMGEGLGDKLFYLTAKTITRAVAEEAFSLLKSAGLSLTQITLTAREKMCPLEERRCDPEHCPYAKGHFDRVNEAVYTLLQEKDTFDRATLLAYAQRFSVCPFEFSLDVSSWTDAVVCDYNYAFDPTARLRRYFGDGVSGDYIFLIDEAHNLVDRGRDMFSAQLVKEHVLAGKRALKEKRPALARRLDGLNRLLLARKRECGEGGCVFESADDIGLSVLRVLGEFDKYLEDEKKPLDDEVQELYFELRGFSQTFERLDTDYRIYGDHTPDGDFFLRLYNIVPARLLLEQLDKGRAAVFFSATLLPVNYYKELLVGDPETPAVYADSPFPRENRFLGIVRDVSSRYKRRGPEEFARIWACVRDAALARSGHYMVYFPSYAFLEGVLDEAAEDPLTELLEPEDLAEPEGLPGPQERPALPGGAAAPDAAVPDTAAGAELRSGTGAPGKLQILCQRRSMPERLQEAFLRAFSDPLPGRTRIGFCVIGGSFSEGIDLTDDSLIGSLVVGPGLPQICLEREILRSYFDLQEKDGFSYAYVYPGMNKVQQAAGRVIRTDTDRGVILLMDERFAYGQYRKLFPREWADAVTLTSGRVGTALETFWEDRTEV